MSKYSFKNKTVLITGASRGIGRVIAEHYLEAGAGVIACARNLPKQTLRSANRKADFIAADIRMSENVQALFSHIKKNYGALDIVINNAGGSPYLPIAKSSPRLLETIMRLNLTAPIWIARQAYPLMRRNGGCIINIASTAGLRAAPETAAYGAAKAGLIHFTQSAAIEWAPKIRVNAIAPGMVLQENSASYYGGKQALARLARTLPMKRLASPQDIADACLFLTAPDSNYISGAVLEMHGGGERLAFHVMQT